MEISKIAELASFMKITYPEVQETEKGFVVTAVISAQISGRDFTFSGLAQGKALGTVSSKSLEAALSLFDGIDFGSLSRTAAPEPETTPFSEPEPVAEIPTPVPEPEPIVEPIPAPTPELESAVEIPTPEPEPEPVAEIPTPEPEPEPVAEISTLESLMPLTTKEIIRLRWTVEQGKAYLAQTYGKKSRSLLSLEEMQEFYQYLRSQPTPVVAATVTPEPLPVAPAIEAVASEPTPDPAPQAVVQSQSPVSEVNPSDLVIFDLEGTTDFERVIQVSNLAIKVLGLSQDEAKAECQQLYMKRSRTLLSDPELIEYTNNLVQRAKKLLSAQAAA